MNIDGMHKTIRIKCVSEAIDLNRGNDTFYCLYAPLIAYAESLINYEVV